VSVVRVALSEKSLLAETFCFFRVLMLRRKASPTETEIRVEYSHMVNEALEMIAVERHPEEISEGVMPSISTDAEAQRSALMCPGLHPPSEVYHNKHTSRE